MRFGVFAMYVCTGSVRTYIAKRRNPLTIPDFGCSRSGNSQFNCSIRNASKKVGNSLSPFWQGKGVVLHDILLIWNNGFDFSFACDQIGHSQFKGVTNGYHPLEPFAEWVCTDLVHTYIAKRPGLPYTELPPPGWGSGLRPDEGFNSQIAPYTAAC